MCSNTTISKACVLQLPSEPRPAAADGRLRGGGEHGGPDAQRGATAIQPRRLPPRPVTRANGETCVFFGRTLFVFGRWLSFLHCGRSFSSSFRRSFSFPLEQLSDAHEAAESDATERTKRLLCGQLGAGRAAHPRAHHLRQLHPQHRRLCTRGGPDDLGARR